MLLAERTGRVIRSFSDVYEVQDAGGIVSCRLRGRFRKELVTVLTGDRVRFVAGPADAGIITGVLPRRNQLVRPPVANVDQVVVVATLVEPPLDPVLLDRLLVVASRQELDVLICLNKLDLCESADARAFLDLYAGAGYRVLAISARTGLHLDELSARLAGRISVMAGPSGVGKSSLINGLRPGLQLRVERVSRAGGRGRHTTRRVELLEVGNQAWVVDTPGFSRLDLDSVPKVELAEHFPDMARLKAGCRFRDCLHRQEPDCAVRAAFEQGSLAPGRYWNYLAFLAEIEELERRRYS
ncbi:MAG TPA: ribosome small subunit-dependent GTPase A [Clostridiales bacterium UBA8153]|nr:ribosome small subunit-dependent GTPase A [Clostridiales bacterium UBA8153]